MVNFFLNLLYRKIKYDYYWKNHMVIITYSNILSIEFEHHGYISGLLKNLQQMHVESLVISAEMLYHCT